MKTGELIAALAADAKTPARPLGRSAALALGAGALISLALFMAMMGPRHDVMAAMRTVRFDLKFVDTLALLAPSFLVTLKLSRPDADPSAMLAWLLAPLALVVVAALTEMMMIPRDLWMTRLIGHNWAHCLMMIPLLSIAPLGVLLAALRAGAPGHPMLTGALAGAAAAGVAATLYATNCTDDLPLFVITWYSLATAIVVFAGALAGSRWLRW